MIARRRRQMKRISIIYKRYPTLPPNLWTLTFTRHQLTMLLNLLISTLKLLTSRLRSTNQKKKVNLNTIQKKRMRMSQTKKKRIKGKQSQKFQIEVRSIKMIAKLKSMRMRAWSRVRAAKKNQRVRKIKKKILKLAFDDILN